jgi:hypothetical protein
MNPYGAMARAHWARWLPGRYKAISDPDSFFSSLGQEAATRISDLALQLAGPDQPGEEYLAKVGRLNMARLQAEELVLPELVLLPPESGADPDQDPDPDQREAMTGRDERPVVVDRGHRLWEQVNAEQEALAAGS